MKLTDTEVAYWMRQHRESFENDPKQLQLRTHDKYKSELSSRQVNQRQVSRFNGYLKRHFAGAKNLKSYLKDGTHKDRMLPPLDDNMPEKTEVARYTNTKGKKKEFLVRRREQYFNRLAWDLAHPNDESAKQRTTKRFARILQRMEAARSGKRYFYEHPP